MKKILKKASVVALSTAVAASAVTPALAAKSPVKGLRPVKRTVTMKASKGVKITYKTTTKGTASIAKVPTKNKTVTISSKVKIKGVTYKVSTVNKNVFTSARRLKTIKVNSTGIKFAKGAFSGLNTKSMKLVITKKVSRKQLKAYKASVKKAGFKGKVVVG